jgi:kynurenine 3-monooxygenase
MTTALPGPVTILGAGLTGSLLATLLAQRGIAVTVYERQPDLRSHAAQGGRSINLALADRGMRGLRLAGLEDAVAPLLRPMDGRLLHLEDGDLEYQPYGQHQGERNYSVSRADLNRLLLDAAAHAGAELHFGQACTAVDVEDRSFVLRSDEDGTERRLELTSLIAADGAGSVARRALAEAGHVRASESLLPHGYKELTIPPLPEGGFRMEPGALHIWPRGGFMLIALPNPGGDFTATLFLPNDGEHGFAALQDGDAVQAFFEEHFPDTPALIPDLAHQFESNPVGILGTVRCEPWHLGGDLLLVGDAAHAIVPFHGQGMNAGFEDCAEFCRLLDAGCPDRETLFGDFSRLRHPEAEAIADMALENYVEMRDTVRDPRFHLRKAVAFELERRCPRRFVPRYSMVMFHAEIPYSEAQSRGALQARLLDELTGDARTLDEIDFARAEALVSERLEPLPGAPA